ncbi:MAG: hypothetical protein ACKERG_04405 [Candidatus Hodgkinia cicadicola]
MITGVSLIASSKSLAVLKLKLVSVSGAHTIADTLQHTLASDAPGWALIGIQIDGVDHRRLRVNGIAESVAEIVVNAKKLVFGGGRSHAIWSVVKAAAAAEAWPLTDWSIGLASGLWVANRDQHLCYVDQDSKIRAELVIAKASGYMCAADVYAKFGSCLKDCIVVDADFNPIKRVSYEVVSSEAYLENCENVEITIETNGAVNVASAVRRHVLRWQLGLRASRWDLARRTQERSKRKAWKCVLRISSSFPLKR